MNALLLVWIAATASEDDSFALLFGHNFSSAKFLSRWQTGTIRHERDDSSHFHRLFPNCILTARPLTAEGHRLLVDSEKSDAGIYDTSLVRNNTHLQLKSRDRLDSSTGRGWALRPDEAIELFDRDGFTIVINQACRLPVSDSETLDTNQEWPC